MSVVGCRNPRITARLAKALGTVIRREREARGITARNFARTLGVYPTAVSKWELGQRNLPLDTLVALCIALDTSPSWLLRQAEKAYVPAPKEILHAAD